MNATQIEQTSGAGADPEAIEYAKCSEAYMAWRKTRVIDAASQEENRISWISFYAGWRAVRESSSNKNPLENDR